MKTIKKISLVLFAALAVSLSSCSSDGGSGGNAAAGTVKGKVNGTTVTSTEMLTYATSVTAGGNTTVVIQGTNMDGKGFQFTINGFDGVGTYEFGGSSSVFRIGTYVEGNATNPLDTQSWTAPYDDDSTRGTISFSDVSSTNLKGTFSFTCKNPNDNSIKDITDGSFNVNLQ